MRPEIELAGTLGLDPHHFGTHSLRRTKSTLINRRTDNLRAGQILVGHRKIESKSGISSNKIVAAGLSMPHSPRLYRDELWLHESGTGWFGRVDVGRGTFERVTFCPGYLRGLAFHGNFAIVGVSRLRADNTALSGLPLDAAGPCRCGCWMTVPPTMCM